MHKFQQSRKLDNARAFLFKTAANLAVDQLRRERVHVRYLNSEMVPQRSDEEPERCEPSAERTVSAVQELDIINTVVAEMPPKVRRAFLLHRGKDLSYPQIAQEMNVSTSMVEKYIVQALRILRERVSQTGD